MPLEILDIIFSYLGSNFNQSTPKKNMKEEMVSVVQKIIYINVTYGHNTYTFVIFIYLVNYHTIWNE